MNGAQKIEAKERQDGMFDSGEKQGHQNDKYTYPMYRQHQFRNLQNCDGSKYIT